MKKNEVPQDHSFISDISKELCYAKNDEGKYEAVLSSGWDVKHQALVSVWDDINESLNNALQEIKNFEKSPIYYYMLLNLMNISTLAACIGFNKFFVKRCLKHRVFKKLNDKKLQAFATAFNISIDDLKNFNPDNIVVNIKKR